MLNEDKRKNNLNNSLTIKENENQEDKENQEIKVLNPRVKKEMIKIANTFIQNNHQRSRSSNDRDTFNRDNEIEVYEAFEVSVKGNPQYVLEYSREIFTYLKEYEVY